MHVVIRGHGLPGLAFEGRERIGVALQVGVQPVGIVAGDAAEARWRTEIDLVGNDFRGPAVHGRRGDRFLYLAWGDLASGRFQMFRRAKLILSRVERTLIDAAADGRALVADVQLQDGRGEPIAARLAPPNVRWSVESAPRIRSAVRAVLIDPADRVLLVRFDFGGAIVWACPGGGIEEGEADEPALRRELDEEVGLHRFEVGPCVWVREHLIPLFGGRWDGQRERFYLVRTEGFEPQPRFTPAELAAEGMTGMRWWTPEELRTSDAVFAPRRLPALLQDLLAGVIAGDPIDAGI